MDISGTDGLHIPSGLGSQRPLSTLYQGISSFEGPYKLTGVVRFNTDAHRFEGWLGQNVEKDIGKDDNSWGFFVQEDNDNNRVKLSADVNNFEMHDFYIHTISKNYTFIGNNLGNYNTTLADWTNRSKAQQVI